jgi:hypothetical protein
MRAQLADLRAAAITPRGDPKRLSAPLQGGLYGSSGRDKQSATL